ncbi:pesticin C-terminus-like muramidase [Desulfovibrio sp. ZJ200]|uniref:pesticin C-terminus-like muramidase n=1 Tax=Desulfovibrio sp. ZJ200 TaxID=2709792 RepID=UPI001F14DBF9|nr:pesticin C-terminus-like muramidase [Desulfovibrio sp. ZJ200]
MVHTEFIRRFLARWETRQLVAYMPCRKRNFTGREKRAECGEPIGASGVTVGTGLDLGQQAEADLRRMGIPAPLTLTDAQCEAVDAAVHGDYIRRAAALYDRDSAGLPFANVPPQAQAVIVSLFYQLGAPSGYPKTWKYLCAGDWAQAARELQTGFKRYANRRADEGRLLAEVV